MKFSDLYDRAGNSEDHRNASYLFPPLFLSLYFLQRRGAGGHSMLIRISNSPPPNHISRASGGQAPVAAKQQILPRHFSDLVFEKMVSLLNAPSKPRHSFFLWLGGLNNQNMTLVFIFPILASREDGFVCVLVLAESFGLQ